MKCEETAGRLVIRDNPVLFWAFALLFVCSGSGCLYLAWTTVPSLTERMLASLIGVGHLAGGAYMMWSEPASAVEIDPLAGRVRIRRRSPFGARTEERLLSSIAGAEVEVGEHSEGGPVYRPTFRLLSGACTPVSVFWYQQEGASTCIADRINRFLGSTTLNKT